MEATEMQYTINTLSNLGRKVEVGDLNETLIGCAAQWLRDWNGSFEFLADVKASLTRNGHLSPGQAKGVLNCWRADINRQPKQTSVDSSDASSPDAVVPGIYIKDDGSIWKVQDTKDGQRRYAKVWVTINGTRLTLSDEHTHGEWEYAPGAIFHLAQAQHMNLEQAKQFILIYGKCVRCGRTLKAAESVERGIGPVCVNYFSEWGA